MSCELPGRKECPVIGLAQNINGLRLQYDALGTKIQNSNDSVELGQLAADARNLKTQITQLETQKNGINRCRICPVV